MNNLYTLCLALAFSVLEIWLMYWASTLVSSAHSVTDNWAVSWAGFWAWKTSVHICDFAVFAFRYRDRAILAGDTLSVVPVWLVFWALAEFTILSAWG